jgi:surfactin synthase thioesterase subunit
MSVIGSPVRLLCFPYAGSSSVIYARWKRRLPAWIEVVPVELPGRGLRMLDALQTSMAGLLEAVSREARKHTGRPFAFFGHSLGALVAFELAHYLEVREMAAPLVVFASGTHAPSRRESEHFANLRSDAELHAELERLAGTPPSVLADPELMELTLPILRADFAVAAGYECASRKSIRCPIHALGGTEDDTTQETLLAWRNHTRGDFALNMFVGGHFFIHDQEAHLLQVIQRRLLTLVGSRRPGRDDAHGLLSDDARAGQR